MKYTLMQMRITKKHWNLYFDNHILNLRFFGTFGEMSSNAKDFVDLAVGYGAEHLGKSVATSTTDTERQALKKKVHDI